MYLISFVGMLRAISASGAPSNYAIFPTASFGRRDAPGRVIRSRERASLRLHISYANVGLNPNFENYAARSCQLADFTSELPLFYRFRIKKK